MLMIMNDMNNTFSLLSILIIFTKILEISYLAVVVVIHDLRGM